MSDWSSAVFSSDLFLHGDPDNRGRAAAAGAARHLVRHRFAPRRPGPAVLSDLLRRAARHRLEADLGWRRGAGLARVVGPERSAVKRPSCFALTRALPDSGGRSEEHTSELQSLMRISYAVFCLKKKHQIQQK